MEQRVEKLNCDLRRHFAELAHALPTDERQQFSFTAQTFPQLLGTLETDQLVIRKGHADYNDYRVDRLEFFAEKATYQQFGLLVLSVVFHPGGSRVRLKLIDPTSTVKNLIIEYEGKTYRDFTYRTKPDEFVFVPGRIDKYPWTSQHRHLFDLPTFRLTNLQQCIVTESDRSGRDTIKGFGSDDASVSLAELLLRMGSPNNRTNEVVLEGEGGFRGVGVHSAEASFYLPGSLAWPDGVTLSSLFLAE